MTPARFLSSPVAQTRYCGSLCCDVNGRSTRAERRRLVGNFPTRRDFALWSARYDRQRRQSAPLVGSCAFCTRPTAAAELAALAVRS